jgi:hypothetical protein
LFAAGIFFFFFFLLLFFYVCMCDSLAPKWLDGSFKLVPKRKMEIIAKIALIIFMTFPYFTQTFFPNKPAQVVSSRKQRYVH